MSTWKKLNPLRRKILGSLTRNIGSGPSAHRTVAGAPVKIKRVLISRPNHRLGNILLVTPLVQEIEAIWPDAEIDVFVGGGAAPSVFEQYKSVKKYIRLPQKPFKSLGKYLKS